MKSEKGIARQGSPFARPELRNRRSQDCQDQASRWPSSSPQDQRSWATRLCLRLILTFDGNAVKCPVNRTATGNRSSLQTDGWSRFSELGARSRCARPAEGYAIDSPGSKIPGYPTPQFSPSSSCPSWSGLIYSDASISLGAEVAPGYAFSVTMNLRIIIDGRASPPLEEQCVSQAAGDPDGIAENLCRLASLQ